jgi:hypothetical protein
LMKKSIRKEVLLKDSIAGLRQIKKSIPGMNV